MKIKEFLYTLAFSLTHNMPDKISVNEKTLIIRCIDSSEDDITDLPNVADYEPETIIFIDDATKNIEAIIRGHLLIKPCEFTPWCEGDIDLDSTLAYEQHYKIADSL